MYTLNSKIIKCINRKTKWVFFDYFDTIVHRKIHSENIKMLWANKMGEKFEYICDSSFIYSVRKGAEENISKDFNGIIFKEYNYKELCEDMYDRFSGAFPNSNLDILKCKEEFYKIALKFEIEIEIENQFEDSEISDLIKYLKNMKYKIAIISDFYLPEEAFKEFLKHFELDVFIDEIFVSCEMKKRKEDSLIYLKILNKLDIKADECIMIGDNYISDYLNPKKIGIYSIYRKYKDKNKINKKNKIEKELSHIWNLNKKNTYSNYAFSIYYFISKLCYFCLKNNIKEIYFLSREGEFLKKLFDIYLRINNIKEIKTFYFFVSRQSTYVPNLVELEKEEFVKLFTQSSCLSLYSFMKSIGFNEKKIMEISFNLDLEINKKISNFSQSKEFKILKDDKLFINEYNRIRIEQKENFNSYINENIGLLNSNQIHLVDVGWKGTIQDNIYQFLEGKYSIFGYYIGLTDNCNIEKNNLKYGLNFSNFPIVSSNFNVWSYDNSFYEKLLYASHPSTVGYQKVNKKIIPLFESFINETKTFQYIKPLQDDIENIFIEINKILINSLYRAYDMEQIFCKFHLKTVCLINQKCIRMQFYLMENHFQNFGDFSWNQKDIILKIMEIYKFNKRKVLKKLVTEGLSIKYMYAGIKILNKIKLKFLIPIYTRLVYMHEKKVINNNENFTNW